MGIKQTNLLAVNSLVRHEMFVSCAICLWREVPLSTKEFDGGTLFSRRLIADGWQVNHSEDGLICPTCVAVIAKNSPQET